MLEEQITINDGAPVAVGLAPDQLTSLRQQLADEQVRLREQVSALRQEARMLSHNEDAKQATLSNHMADGGTELYEQEQAVTLANSQQERLTMVEQALLRMDEGTYGRCVNCDQPIAFERLEALPYTPYCIRCQAALQREQSGNGRGRR